MTRNWWSGLAAAAGLALAAAPADAAWRKAESENFILYSQSGDDKVREQVALLEDYHQFLRLLTGVTDPPAPNKLQVYLVRGRDQLNTVRKVPATVGGFYGATGTGIAAFADDKAGGWGASDDEVLFHEIAHHFMMQYRPMAYPAWFIEGFAEYVMTSSFKPGMIEFGKASPHRAAWLASAKWLPIERVLFEMPPHGAAEATALYYAQSWLLAHYMMRDPERKKKFVAYLTAASTGTLARKAWSDQFGADFRAFEKSLRDYGFKQMTYSRMKRASAAVQPTVRIERLPQSADDLLLLEAAMHVGVDEDAAAAHLARVRREAARHPGDAYAKRVLAEAEVLYGDGAKGEALLTELLAAAPADAELLYLMGMRHLMAGRADEGDGVEERYKQAKIWFARSHKSDRYRFQTLARYAESLTVAGDFNSDNTMEIVLLARELAPQVSELGMNAANLLLMRGRYAEAESVLLPLASDPHSPGLAAAAQALLARARAKGKPESATGE